jgi:hypothetical protein
MNIERLQRRTDIVTQSFPFYPEESDNYKWGVIRSVENNQDLIAMLQVPQSSFELYLFSNLYYILQNPGVQILFNNWRLHEDGEKEMQNFAYNTVTALICNVLPKQYI